MTPAALIARLREMEAYWLRKVEQIKHLWQNKADDFQANADALAEAIRRIEDSTKLEVAIRSHFTQKLDGYCPSTEGNTWTDGYIDGVVEVLNYLDHQSSETGAPMNEGPLDLVDGITGRAGVPRE